MVDLDREINLAVKISRSTVCIIVVGVGDFNYNNIVFMLVVESSAFESCDISHGLV